MEIQTVLFGKMNLKCHLQYSAHFASVSKGQCDIRYVIQSGTGAIHSIMHDKQLRMTDIGVTGLPGRASG